MAQSFEQDQVEREHAILPTSNYDLENFDLEAQKLSKGKTGSEYQEPVILEITEDVQELKPWAGVDQNGHYDFEKQVDTFMDFFVEAGECRYSVSKDDPEYNTNLEERRKILFDSITEDEQYELDNEEQFVPGTMSDPEIKKLATGEPIEDQDEYNEITQQRELDALRYQADRANSVQNIEAEKERTKNEENDPYARTYAKGTADVEPSSEE